MVIINISQNTVIIFANSKFSGDVTKAQQYIKSEIEKHIALGVFYFIPEWQSTTGEPFYDGPYPSYWVEPEVN